LPSNGWKIGLDGWSNSQGKPLINVVFVTTKGNMSLVTIDTNFKNKDLNFITKVMERSIGKVDGDSNVVVTLKPLDSQSLNHAHIYNITS